MQHFSIRDTDRGFDGYHPLWQTMADNGRQRFNTRSTCLMRSLRSLLSTVVSMHYLFRKTIATNNSQNRRFNHLIDVCPIDWTQDCYQCSQCFYVIRHLPIVHHFFASDHYIDDCQPMYASNGLTGSHGDNGALDCCGHELGVRSVSKQNIPWLFKKWPFAE